jgi:hypothetical protein
MVVEFKGKTSHAAFDPWNGRSALDGLELFTHARSPEGQENQGGSTDVGDVS